jgi:hypothetical protein
MTRSPQPDQPKKKRRLRKLLILGTAVAAAFSYRQRKIASNEESTWRPAG